MDDVDTKFAPYRANLKNDKLRLVIDETTGAIWSYALPAANTPAMQNCSLPLQCGSSMLALQATRINIV